MRYLIWLVGLWLWFDMWRGPKCVRIGGGLDATGKMIGEKVQNMSENLQDWTLRAV